MNKTWLKNAPFAVGVVLGVIILGLAMAACIYLGDFIYRNMNLGAFITFIVILAWSLMPSRVGSSRK